jgi:hypothetical protein
MQLKKYHHKLRRNTLVAVGTPREQELVPRWTLGKTTTEVFFQVRSRELNPQDPMFDANAKERYRHAIQQS